MYNFFGKKLLIIGGAFQHCKLVENAKRMGVVTYVVDYLPIEKAPAKQIADFHFECDIFNIDAIVDYCIKNKIDGVLASHLDACQHPYQQVCERLGFPCFGDKKQFEILTNKTSFIKACKENGVDTIIQYDENEKVDYPVFVKPADSRGSRGQSICFNIKQLTEAVKFAKDCSDSKKVVIEKYMEGKQDFSVTYFVVNGGPFLIRLCDRYEGNKSDGLDKLCQGCIAPSMSTNLYLKSADSKVKKLIKNIGIKNGPVFMQGFIDGDKVRMYDPGLRFPGGEYERLFEKSTGINLSKAVIEIALTGAVQSNIDFENSYLLNNNFAIQLDISLRPGRIKKIFGLDDIKKDNHVLAIAQRYFIGDEIIETHDVRQRLCEIAFIVNKNENYKNITKEFLEKISVVDDDNREMVVSKISCEKLFKEE